MKKRFYFHADMDVNILFYGRFFVAKSFAIPSLLFSFEFCDEVAVVLLDFSPV